jgi:hypothetical protein
VYRNKIYIIIIITVSLFASSIAAKEVSKTGTTAGKFLSIGVGPRANAMGGAFSSISNDASAMYWNPGGLALLNQPQVFISYTKMFADLNVDYLGIVIPMGEAGVFGVNVTALAMGDMKVTTEDYPDGTGETFSAGSYAFGLSYGKHITDDFLFGVNIKYIREDISNSSASGFGIDIGTIFNTPFYGIRFSSSISNYGSKMQMEGDDLLIRHDANPNAAGNNGNVDAYYSTDQYELPLKLQIGISRDFTFLEDNRFTIAIDGIHPNDNDQYVNVGGELMLLNDMFFLRGGYKSLFLKDSEESLTLGVGINYNKMEFFSIAVDYAFQQYKHLGDTHSFGILLRF